MDEFLGVMRNGFVNIPALFRRLHGLGQGDLLCVFVEKQRFGGYKEKFYGRITAVNRIHVPKVVRKALNLRRGHVVRVAVEKLDEKDVSQG